MATTIPYRSFAAGEISKRLSARTDQVKYNTGAYTMRNMVPTLEGAAQNRSGSGYVRPCHDFTAATAPRLLPFVYSDDQSYVIVLENNWLSIISLGTPQFEDTLTITAITQANPCKVTTSTDHGFLTGQLVWFDGIGGMTQLNRRFFRVLYTSPHSTNEFSIQEEAGDFVSTVGYDAFTTGGTASNVYRTVSPYSLADIPEVVYAHSGDVAVFTHPAHQNYTLTRSAGPTWTFTQAWYAPRTDEPTGINFTATAGTDIVGYKVSAVNDGNLEESFAGFDTPRLGVSIDTDPTPWVATYVAHGYVTGDVLFSTASPGLPFGPYPYTITRTGADTFTIDGSIGFGMAYPPVIVDFVRNVIRKRQVDAPAQATPITLTWTAVPGALEYNIYREQNGVYGWIGASPAPSFVDKGYVVDQLDTPLISREAFAAASNFPGVCGFFQQRLLLARTLTNKEEITASRINMIFNFSSSQPIQVDDSFSWVMRSEKVQGIKHIMEMSRCIVFTQSCVWTLEGNEAGAISPGVVYPRKRAEHGVGDVPPIAVGNAVIYVQAFGKVVHEIIPGSGDDFNSKNLTVYSRHLFDRNAIIDWTYAEEPSSVVWAARDDGTMLGFTYQREHQIEGWSRHDTGDGDEIVGMCSVPEGEESATYLVVRRYDIGPSFRYYIERMATRQIAHAADGKFLDGYRFYEDENEDAAKTYRLEFNDDHSDADAWSLTKTGTSPSWVVGVDSTDLGRVFLLYGPEGERIWCTISEIISTSVALVSVRTDVRDCLTTAGAPNDDDVDEDVGIPFPITLPYTTNDWSKSIAVITDLWHLEGREVYVVGDGLPQGPFTVEDGTITLEAPAVLVVAGLQIIADLETLEPENPEGGPTWADRVKTVGKVTIRVEETDGLQVGLSVKGLQDWRSAWLEPDKFRAGHLYTGRLSVENKATKSPTGRVLLRQSSGLPTTILGVYPQIEIE